MESRFGCTRYVILTRRFAIKIPQFKYSWRLFLIGLLANMQERGFSKIKDARLCPVLFSVSGGWLIVMPKCRELTREEFFNMNIKIFHPPDLGDPVENGKNGNWEIPVENKLDSFGWYRNRIVAIDYGS